MKLRILIVVLVVTLGLQPARATTFVAYSMKEASRQLEGGASSNVELSQLGGMTHLLGMVYDKQHGDCILVGISVEGKPPLALDDVVVAMRAIMIHGQPPLVTIEKTAETDKTGMQAVLFEGGIENSALGKAMLDIDLELKRLALGKFSAEIWGVHSYASLLAAQTRKESTKSRVISRFWVSNPKPSFATRKEKGVFVIMELNPLVKTEVLYAEVDGKPVTDLTAVRDEVGDAFASQVTNAMDDLAVGYPVFAKIKPILAIVSLAAGMREIVEAPHLEYWLKQYRVPFVQTPEQVELVRAREEMRDISREWVLTGGIRSNPVSVKLKKGYPTAFRDVVLQSRPSLTTLVWHPPLESWPIPGEYDVATETNQAHVVSSSKPAFSLDALLRPSDVGRSVAQPPFPATAFKPLRATMPQIIMSGGGNAVEPASGIGGVMLSGTAQVEGAQRAEACLADGNFSLVVDGDSARLDPELFRKFVTALWCVYYSGHDPGVSIDPIGGEITPETKRHLVRYIGRVINTDLSRVMREADYLMKKWAVGTERPDFPGFRPVDGWMAQFGAARSGVSRRFWFVSEQLRFRQSGGLLLFDSGCMRLRTEYDVDGLRGQAGPADEKFAQFFTDHYAELAEQYPIYKELFEYAKLVALAKYLKEQGVPLHWFLLAHKDLVITEDSPGTVEQLAKGSEYFHGMTLIGGVDLAPNSQYVYDEEAMAAVRQALESQRAAGPAPSSGAPRRDHPVVAVQRVSFQTGQQSYTVLPQHSLTSGRDHHGNRYQTDFALRRAGEPALELVRYFDPRRRDSGQFGRGWHLLIPYRVEAADRQTRPFLNAIIPERMVLENLLSGRREVLVFSTDRYAIAGYVPEQADASQVIGLFLMSNGSFRLADKLGNQFHFDPRGRMTGMFLSPSPEHQMQIEYADQFTAAFIQPPYAVRPVGEEQVDFLNARIPKRVRVTDRVNDYAEVLTFSPDRDIPGYVPSDTNKSRFQVAALLTNGGLQLLDKHGNQIRLTPDWDFDSALPAPQQRMVRSLSMGGRKVTFGYTLDAQGQVVIATAAVSENQPHAEPTWVVRYEYDRDGRLCRVQRFGSSVPPTLSAALR